MSFWKKLVSYIWTPFNRDSLWNCCLKANYCTYNPHKVKLGLIFCHVDDDTHKHRVNIGVELLVLKVINNNTFILKIPYLVNIDTDFKIPISNIEVITLKDHNLNPGDYFNVYGHYELVEYKKINSDYNCMKLVLVNDNNNHIYKEPFIDLGFDDR